MLRFQHTAMATQFEIRCTHRDEAYARQAARAAFDVVDRLEQPMSRFIEHSDISRINHLSAGESATVGFESMQCLRLAATMFDETEGAFDVAKGTGFAELEVAPEQFVVTARADGIRLDLGAIGKGYAVDRIADVLEDWDVTDTLIDAGQSSVLALGPPAGESGWPLTLSDPRVPGLVLVTLHASQCVLGASGIRKGDHIVDPRRQAPVRTRQAAWVLAPRAVASDIGGEVGGERSPTAIADALSTAAMINSVDWIDAYCRAHPGVEAWVLDEDLRHFPGSTRATRA